MEYNLVFILFVICVAFIFDFTNGFHDAGNSIATIVATRVLKPFQAVIWAAFFNFIAFLSPTVVLGRDIRLGVANASMTLVILECSSFDV